MHDPIFYGDRFPFRNPEILRNGEIDAAEIERMQAPNPYFHEEPVTLEEEAEDSCPDSGEYCTPPTQPAVPATPPALSKANPFDPPSVSRGMLEHGPPMTRRRAATSSPSVEGPSAHTPPPSRPEFIGLGHVFFVFPLINRGCSCLHFGQTILLIVKKNFIYTSLNGS